MFRVFLFIISQLLIPKSLWGINQIMHIQCLIRTSDCDYDLWFKALIVIVVHLFIKMYLFLVLNYNCVIICIKDSILKLFFFLQNCFVNLYVWHYFMEINFLNHIFRIIILWTPTQWLNKYRILKKKSLRLF